MKWKKTKLGDIADFSNGINFDRTAYAPGIKLIGVSNFGDRFMPDYDNLDEIKPDIVQEGDYLKDGDIVFVRSNGNKELVGRCMLITNPPVPVTFSGFCIRVRIKDRAKYDPVFLTYHFKDTAFRRIMSGTALGANIQNLSQGRLNNYLAMIPDYEWQRKIANILWMYDSLIENNQKQIKLLEEAAQRLYMEWFVVDDVPNGWERQNLGDVASVLRRGISPKYDNSGKYLVISQKCIRQSIMDISEARRESKEYAPELNLQDKDTVICSTGTGTLGRVGQVFGVYPDTTFDSHVTLVRIEQYPNFFYQSIKHQQSFLMDMGRGSTNQQELYRGVIEGLQILIPSQETLNKAENMLSAIHDKITALNSQIGLLDEARDRLLPKLMSGEIEL